MKEPDTFHLTGLVIQLSVKLDSLSARLETLEKRQQHLSTSTIVDAMEHTPVVLEEKTENKTKEINNTKAQHVSMFSLFLVVGAIAMVSRSVSVTTEAIADLQSMTIPPPRAPPALPSMVHHLQVIKELKALFIQPKKQQNKKDTVEQLTAFSSFTTGIMEAVPTCATIHQPNIQSMNQPAVTITRQSTVIDSDIKANIRTDQSINLSTIYIIPSCHHSTNPFARNHCCSHLPLELLQQVSFAIR
jgi:hypothetical protein